MNTQLPPRPIIAPSILSANFADLATDIGKVTNGGWIHVDIMDGHFVPNLSFGPDITKTVNTITDQILDVHLMIEEPEQWVDRYIAAGADCIIFHVEAVDGITACQSLIDHLHAQGVRAGFSVKPATPIEDYLDVVDSADLVLVMSVEPGFGGQSFMADQLDKVRLLRDYIDSRGLDTIIEIDGGISTGTIEKAAEAGVDAFVAGSAVFGAPDPHAMVDELHTLAAQVVQ